MTQSGKGRSVVFTNVSLRRRRDEGAFTLVEVVIVIVVIAILATLVTVGLLGIQKDARDAQRASSTTTLAEALERYYEKNNEYPGCSLLNGDKQTVSALLGVDQDALSFPRSSETGNALRCESANASDDDVYVYKGDGSATCTSGTACLFWTIQYNKEADGSLVQLQSRRQVAIDTSGTPILNGSVTNSTTIALSWTAVPNAVSYNLQRSTSASFTSPVTTTLDSAVTSTSVTSLSAGTTYYFRINAASSTGAGPWSNTRTLTTGVSAPSATTTSVTRSAAVITATASAATCLAGTTPQYQFSYSSTSTSTAGSWSSYSSWSSSATYTVTSSASEGYEYSVRTQLRCSGPSAQSSAATNPTVTAVMPISTPAKPTIQATISSATATGTITAITCPSGTSAQYQTRYRTGTSTSGMGAWSSYDTWNSTATRSQSVSEGSSTGFQGQVRCTSDKDTSDTATSDEATVVRDYTTPSAPSVSSSLSGSTATLTVTAVTCPGGATAQYRTKTRISNVSSGGNWATYTAWGTTTTVTDSVNQGYRRGYIAQVRCVGEFSTSGASSESDETSVIMAISKPASPTYTGKTSWEAGYRYAFSYTSACPSGTWVTSEGIQYYNTGFSGGVRYPSSGYYIATDYELWWLGWDGGQVYEDVYYYGRYRCASDWATSPYSDNTSTRIEVSCPPSRRSYSASPLCHSAGQSWSTQPIGP